MPPDARKKCPAAVAATTGTTNSDLQEHSQHPPNIQADNHDWYTLEFQRAVNILADPIYRGLQIQVAGQAGCGHRPPTADPDELERFAREVGLDASYSVLTANGRVSWPVLIDLSPGNGDVPPPNRTTKGRAPRRIPVAERNP